MESTTFKSWTFVITFSLFILIFGYFFGGRLGLLVSFCISLILNLLVFFYGKPRIVNYFKTKEVRGHDSYQILKIGKKISEQLEIEIPKFFIFQSRGINSFAINQPMLDPSIYLSSELVRHLSASELELVIALLMSRIKKQNNLTYAIGSLIGNSILGIGSLLDQISPVHLFKSNKPSTEFFTYFLAPAVGFFLSLINKPKAILEYDKETAEKLDAKFEIGNLIWKLHGFSLSRPIATPVCTSHLYLIDPDLSKISSNFNSHPSIEKRIKSLLGYYPV